MKSYRTHLWAPIPCTYRIPDTESDSSPIVSEPGHVTFANDTAVPSKTLHWAGTQSDMTTMCLVPVFA